MSWEKGQYVKFVGYVGPEETQMRAKALWQLTPGASYLIDDFLTGGKFPHVMSDNNIGVFESDDQFEFELVSKC